jgi:hypothetical protein
MSDEDRRLLSVERALLELLSADVGVESILRELRRASELDASAVDRAMGWPEGRCEAVEAGEVRLEKVKEIVRLKRCLGGQAAVERVVVEMAVSEVSQGLEGGPLPHQVLVVYACYLAVRDADVALLYSAMLELAATLGMGDEVDADPGDFAGGGG